MGTILDKAYEQEDERLEKLRKEQKQKVCSTCGKVHEEDTETCFECMYIMG
jgi:uncharacterized paraquat-inducible protein A